MAPSAVARLTLDSGRVGRTENGLVWAGLHLDLEGRSFPEREWTDFAVVVLSWWMDALRALAGGSSRRAKIDFMEGPASVEIANQEDGSWRLRCIRRGLRRVTEDEAIIDRQALLESAIGCAEGILDICRINQWWTVDADALERGKRALLAEIAH